MSWRIAVGSILVRQAVAVNTAGAVRAPATRRLATYTSPMLSEMKATAWMSQ